MAEKIKIKSLEIKPGISKTGRAYNLAVITTEDGRKISKYIDNEYDIKTKKLAIIQGWKIGEEINLSIEQKGEYLNFDIPSRVDLIDDKVKDHEERIVLLETAVSKVVHPNAQKTK